MTFPIGPEVSAAGPLTRFLVAGGAAQAPSGVPAWQSIESWAVIGTADHVLPPAEQEFMADRADAHVTEVNAGHLSMISRPDAVAGVIAEAASASD